MTDMNTTDDDGNIKPVVVIKNGKVYWVSEPAAKDAGAER